MASVIPLTNDQIAERQTLAQIIKNHSNPAISDEIIYTAAESLIRSLEINNGLIMKSKPVEKAFKCDICVFSTSFQVNLDNHIRIAHTEKSFKCDLCEYTSSFKVNLDNHKVSKHKEASEAYSSEDFEEDEDSDDFGEIDYKRKYKTNTRRSIDNDEISPVKESGDKPWKCDQCPYSTNYKSALRDHKRAHDGYRPFKCTKCDYAAVNKSNLTKHLRIHTGEKPYKCNLCKYSAAQKSTLASHKRNAHNEGGEEEKEDFGSGSASDD